MRLFTHNEPYSGSKICGIEYTLPNGQKKIIEERMSMEAIEHTNPEYIKNKLVAMAEYDIRRNIGTTDLSTPYQAYYTNNDNLNQSCNSGLLQQYAQSAYQQQIQQSGWGRLGTAYLGSGINKPTITHKFYRINKLVELPEGSEIKGIDRLRYEVYKWLYN